MKNLYYLQCSHVAKRIDQKDRSIFVEKVNCRKNSQNFRSLLIDRRLHYSWIWEHAKNWKWSDNILVLVNQNVFHTVDTAGRIFSITFSD